MGPEKIKPTSPTSSMQGGTGIVTQGETHTRLDPAPVYSNKTKNYMQPSWGEKYFNRFFKKAGLGISCVLCGALAIGLLPFTLVGGVLFMVGSLFSMAGGGEEFPDSERVWRSHKIGAVLEPAGMILAAPLFGLGYCMDKIKNMRYRLESTQGSFQQYVTSPDMSINQKGYEKDLNKFTRYELKQLYTNIQKFNPDTPVLGRKKEVLDLVEKVFKEKFKPKTS